MKKIIALAVASAFVAPVMAADITLSGDIEYQIVDDNSATTAQRDGDDHAVYLSVSEEIGNGLTVSADVELATQDLAQNGGDNITIAGSFGSVAIGQSSGGLDSFGDYTDVSPQEGGFALDGKDAFVTFKPALEGPFKVAVSYSPEDASDTGAASEHTAIGVAFDFAGGQVYAGQDQRVDTGEDVEILAYGAKYTFNGVMIAMEAGTEKQTSGTEAEYDVFAFAVKYSLGNTTFTYESQNQQTDGGADVTIAGKTVSETDEGIFAITQNLGGGLKVYVEASDDDKATDADKTTFGIKYSF